MRRSIRIAAVVAALCLAFPLANVNAAPGQGIHFEVHTTLGAPSGGPFTASGPAVDSGLVCATGDTVDVSLTVLGRGSNGRVNYGVLKDFICDDGSGSLLLKLQVQAGAAKGDVYSWTIAGGTGAYMALQGTGSGSGALAPPDSGYTLDDQFDGVVQ